MKFQIGKGIFACAELHELDSSMTDLYRLKGGWLSLTNVYVHPFIRGRGYGQRIMEQVITYADKEGVGLLLQIRPYSRWKRMRTEQLREWYATFGFRWRGDNIMTRRARCR